MNAIEFLLILLVAFVLGIIAQMTSGYSRGGFIVNLGFSFLGALAGFFGSSMLDAPVLYDLHLGVITFPIIYSVIGSVIFLAVIGLFLRPGRL
jgi:uncharacterized membrane protein YeaQ/YmgE (transglycosylase-associated protein family)